MSVVSDVARRDDVVPAHPVSGVSVSRRTFLMNTAVRVASVASAVAIASPSIAADNSSRRAPAQVLARAEQMMQLLRTDHAYIGNHFKIDEPNAERALRWFRDVASGRRTFADESEEFGCVVEFLRNHGQSIDWIFDGDVSAMICKNASNAPCGGMAIHEDPIFPLIRTHNEIDFNWRIIDQEHSRLDRIRYQTEKTEKDFRRVDKKWDKAVDRWYEIFNQIVDCVPTTREGLHSKLCHLNRMATKTTVYSPDDVGAEGNFAALLKSIMQSV